jgi:hypothetical protein
VGRGASAVFPTVARLRAGVPLTEPRGDAPDRVAAARLVARVLVARVLEPARGVAAVRGVEAARAVEPAGRGVMLPP